MSYGDKLKSLRKKTNITQAQLAAAVGSSVSVISMIESGLRQPSRETSIRLANYFNVPVDVFLLETTAIPDGTSPVPRVQIDPGLMTDIIDAITEFLDENNLEMSPEQRKDLIKHFCDKGLTDQRIIKETLSVVQALGLGIFTNKR